MITGQMHFPILNVFTLLCLKTIQKPSLPPASNALATHTSLTHCIHLPHQNSSTTLCLPKWKLFSVWSSKSQLGKGTALPLGVIIAVAPNPDPQHWMARTGSARLSLPPAEDFLVQETECFPHFYQSPGILPLFSSPTHTLVERALETIVHCHLNEIERTHLKLLEWFFSCSLKETLNLLKPQPGGFFYWPMNCSVRKRVQQRIVIVSVSYSHAELDWANSDFKLLVVTCVSLR